MTAVGLPASTPAPRFTLTAVYTRRRFSLQECLGTPVLLSFVSYATRDSVRTLATAVRKAYPSISDVILASLINLRSVPSLARGMAERMMEAALREAAQEVPGRFKLEDHLILLPDWSGKVFQAYRMPEIEQEVGLALVDREGRIAASCVCADPARAALELLKQSS